MNIWAFRFPRLLLPAVAAAALLAAPPLSAQNEKESFTGFAINMNSGPTTAVVDFAIERWSSSVLSEAGLLA